MNDDLAGKLNLRLTRSFRGARQITLMAERDGRLVLVGEPSEAQILGASMMLATVHGRVSRDHAYVSPAIPGPALLRALERADRGTIMVAPVLACGSPVGVVFVEAWRGLSYFKSDLERLEGLITVCA